MTIVIVQHNFVQLPKRTFFYCYSILLATHSYDLSAITPVKAQINMLSNNFSKNCYYPSWGLRWSPPLFLFAQTTPQGKTLAICNAAVPLLGRIRCGPSFCCVYIIYSQSLSGWYRICDSHLLVYCSFGNNIIIFAKQTLTRPK